MSFNPNPQTASEVLTAAAYMTKLAAECSHELGFIPNTVYPKAIIRGNVKFSTENGEPCGFLLHGPARHETRVYQTAIDFDLRRLEHGTHAVQRLIKEALENDQEKIILHCACDLPANRFWSALDFVCRGTRHEKHASRRTETRWELILPRGEDLERYLADQLKKTKAAAVLELFGQTGRFLAHRRKNYRTGSR